MLVGGQIPRVHRRGEGRQRAGQTQHGLEQHDGVAPARLEQVPEDRQVRVHGVEQPEAGHIGDAEVGQALVTLMTALIVACGGPDRPTHLPPPVYEQPELPPWQPEPPPDDPLGEGALEGEGADEPPGEQSPTPREPEPADGAPASPQPPGPSADANDATPPRMLRQ
jgi:hypothetical protein